MNKFISLCFLIATLSVVPKLVFSQCDFAIYADGYDSECAGNCSGFIQVEVLGGTSPFSYEWNDGNVTPSLDGMCPGVYEVTVTDAVGCTAITSVLVYEPPFLELECVVVSGASGEDTSDGAVAFNISGGTPPYFITGGGGTVSINSLESDGLTEFFDWPAGTYNFGVSDLFSCVEYCSFEILVQDECDNFISEIVSNSPSTCLNDNNDQGACAKVCPNSTQIYSVPGTEGQELTWEVIGAESFEVMGDELIVNWGAPGSGLITVVSEDACNLNVSGSTSFDGSTSSSSISLSVTGGTPGYTFQWSNGSSVQNPSGLPPGNYTVTVTDAENCGASETFTIVNGNNPDCQGFILGVELLNESSCGAYDGSIYLELSGPGGFSTNWTGPDGLTSTNQFLIDVPSGIYTVQISDANGNMCTAVYEISCNSGSSATPTVQAGTVSFNPGQSFACVPFTAQNFSGITDFDFTFNLNDVVGGSYIVMGVSGEHPSVDGSLMSSIGPETFNITATLSAPIFIDGEVLFELCFNISSNAECNSIPITFDPQALFLGANNAPIDAEFIDGAMYICEPPPSCPVNGQLCVDILEEVISDFTTTPPAIAGEVTICASQTVYFESQSINAETYVWDFGTGENATSASTQFTYDDPGTYLVYLIARNECFCADTSSVTINVEPAQIPELDCAGSICAGTEVTYTTDDSCSSYSWDVSGNGTIIDGGTSTDNFVTIDWGNGPTGTISLAVNGCAEDYCVAENFTQIPIISDNDVIKGPENVCKGELATYSFTNYGGTNFDWTVSFYGEIIEGLGTSEIVVQWTDEFIPPNDQWVKVDYENCYLECGGSDQLFVHILDEYFFNGPIENCVASSVTYDAYQLSGGPAVCDWNLKDINGTSVFSVSGLSSATIEFPAASGIYQLEATPTNPDDFCLDLYQSFVQVVDIPEPPTAITGPTLVCTDVASTYYVVADGENVTYEWLVNDGGNITERVGGVINVTWTSGGPYNLQVYQNSTLVEDCESTPIGLEVFTVQDLAIEGPTEACVETVQVYVATDYENFPYNWSIIPADAGTIIAGEFTNTIEVLWHISGNPGVALNVCNVPADVPMTIYPRPEPVVIAPEIICAGEAVEVSTTESYVSYQWVTEGGATASTDPTPSLNAGHYAVVAVDENGCTGKEIFFMDTWPIAEVSLTTPGSTGYCIDEGEEPPTFYNLEADPALTYTWYFNGSEIPGITTSSYTPPLPGYGSYSVIITDEFGCTRNSSSVELFEWCEPSGSGVCTGGNCTFDPCPVFEQIKFQINSTEFCNVSEFVNLSYNFIEGSLVYHFDDPESGSDNTSTDENPTHTYAAAGFHAVYLTGDILVDGVVHTCEWTIVDNVPLVADFKAELACESVPTVFTSLTSTLPGTMPVGWEWDFGDPGSGAANTSVAENPTHIYNTVGDYEVNLIVTDASGCIAISTQTISVYPLPEANIAATNLGCANSAIDFYASVDPAVISVVWDFDDPSSGDANTSRLFETFHQFGIPGTYNVSLTAFNIYGCEQIFTTEISIVNNPLSGNITASPGNPICEGETALLSPPPGGTQWAWSTGQFTSTILTGQAGGYWVTITDDDGCEYISPEFVLDITPAPSGAIRVVEYNEYNQPIGYFYDNYAICEGEDVFLEVNETDGYSYSWSTGVNGTEIDFSEFHNNQLGGGNYDFQVTVTDESSGCTAIAGPYYVEVYDQPDPIILSTDPGGFLCDNTPATISIVDPQPGLTYVWNTGVIGAVAIIAETPGKYYVKAVNANGCETESEEVEIHEGPNINQIPSGCHRRCAPDTLCLPYMPTISSWQWYFNDTPLAAPDGQVAEIVAYESGDYYVEMIDIYGCHATSGIMSLELFTGIGTVSGEVYFDVNGNGIIDGPDTLMSNQTVFIEGEDYNNSFTSDANGFYAFEEILAIDYTLYFDSLALPSNYQVIQSVQETLLEGCDDEEVVNWLVVEQACLPLATNLTLSTCQNTTIEYHDLNLDPNTTTEVALVTPEGCDSLVTVFVQELEHVEESVELETCAQTLMFDGTELTVGSITPFIYVNYQGCDSTLMVSVLASDIYTSSKVLNACENGSVEYNGLDLMANSTTDVTLQSLEGCDSIVTVTVEPIPLSESSMQLDGCAGSTVMYEGELLPTGSITPFVYVNYLGCDSTLYVEVLPITVLTGEEHLSACAGQMVEYEGQNLMPNTTTEVTVLTADGCDSLVTVFVDELSSVEESIELETCSETVMFDGSELAVGSATPFIYVNYQGCDSTLMVSVLASDIYTSSKVLNACENGSVEYNGLDLMANSTTDVTLQSLEGCDSIVTVTVEPISLSEASLELEGCEGSSVIFDGEALPAGSITPFVYVNYLGCDSTLYVEVLALPVLTGEEHFSACAGQMVEYEGQNLMPNTTTEVTLQTADGCDSLVTVMVEELSSVEASIELETCSETMMFDGMELPVGSATPFIYVNYQGCDSTLMVSVLASDIYTSSKVLNACENGSVEYNGLDLMANSTTDVTLQSMEGCDSIVTVTVEPISLSEASLELEGCEGSSVIFDGEALPAGSITPFVYVNYLGCDSTLYVEVLALPVLTGEEHLSACAGQMVEYEGQNLMPNTTTEVTLQTADGCDSLVTVMVEELEATSANLELFACEGTSAIFQGESLAIGSSTPFFFINTQGCDSTLMVAVSQVSAVVATESFSACSDEVVDYNGIELLPNTTTDVTLTTFDGCDSIVTVTVEELMPTTASLELFSCEGASTTYDGQSLMPGESTMLSYTNAAGCDSSLLLIVTAFAVPASTENLEACDGAEVEYNGVNYMSGTTTEVTLTSYEGCDSLVTLTVAAIPLSTTEVNLEGCEGETVIYDGQPFVVGTQNDIVLTSFQGCDSTITVIVATLGVIEENLVLETCLDEAIFYDGEELWAGDQQSFLFITEEGCDSMVNVTVAAFPEFELALATEIICPETYDGEILVENINGVTGPYTYSLDGENFSTEPTFSNLPPGYHLVHVMDVNSCIQAQEIEIPAFEPLLVNIADVEMECDANEVMLDAIPLSGLQDLEILWPDGSTGTSYLATESGPVSVVLTNGCESYVQTTQVVSAIDNRDSYFYIPNSFSPNNDGFNDQFLCFASADTEVLSFEMHIYNRWGAVMYESFDIKAGWDGVFKNKLMNPGIYVWWVQAKVIHCHQEIDIFEKGDIAIFK